MLFTTPVTVSPASKDARYFALMVFTCAVRSVCPAFSAAALSVDALSELLYLKPSAVKNLKCEMPYHYTLSVFNIFFKNVFR